MPNTLNLSSRELQFLRFTCSALTYKEIASLMNISPKTVENYREKMFDIFNVKSRVDLVITLLRLRIILLEELTA
jgi:DNA-binding CsgD family transcriptional regulator